MNYYVVYISPAGTTRHVAQVIAEQLSALGRPCRSFDLGDSDCRAEIQRFLDAVGP